MNTVWMLVKSDDHSVWYGVYGSEEDADRAVGDRYYYLRGKAENYPARESVDWHGVTVIEVTVGEDRFE
jgi:hypothetical protein